MPNALNKSLELVKTYSGTLASSFAYSGGTVTIRAAEPITGNYAYIPKIGRYYFVDNVTLLGDACSLTLRCDVLTTFADSIKQATATRIKGGANTHLSNNGGYNDVRPLRDVEYFPNSEFFTQDGTIILITLKGK